MWSYYVPFSIIIICSAVFEIFEFTVVQFANFELGEAYLGMQGDIWDAQKDTICAIAGTIVSLAIIFLTSKSRRHQNR